MTAAQHAVAAGARAARLRPHRRKAAHPLILGVALLVAAFALLPAGFVIWVLIDSGFDTATALIFRPRVGELLVATLLLEVVAVPISIALALALAFITERSDLPLRDLWRWLAVAPLAIPAFVQAFAWDSAFPMVRGLWPAVAISVLAYFPFAYLPIIAQLRRLDPAHEEVAATLGESPAKTFLTVVLPQLRLAICGGGVLIALHLLAEYGLYVLIRYDTLTVAIVNQFQAVYDGPAANLMGFVLVALAAIVLLLDAFLRGDRRYARLGQGGARTFRPVRLGKAAPLWMLIPAATTALAIGLPLWVLVRWLAVGGADRIDWGALGGAASETALYASLGAVLVCLAAIPVSWLAARSPGPLQRWLEGLQFYAGALPGVIVALALVAVTVRIALPLYQTVATLVAAYVLLFLPRAVVAVRASLAQVPIELEFAAISLGDSPARAALGTTLRLSAAGIAAGMALVAMGVTTELTATLMLSPIGTETLATRFWALTGEFDHVGAAPFALAMIVLSIPLCVILHRQAVGAIGR